MRLGIWCFAAQVVEVGGFWQIEDEIAEQEARHSAIEIIETSWRLQKGKNGKGGTTKTFRKDLERNAIHSKSRRTSGKTWQIGWSSFLRRRFGSRCRVHGWCMATWKYLERMGRSSSTTNTRRKAGTSCSKNMQKMYDMVLNVLGGLPWASWDSICKEYSFPGLMIRAWQSTTCSMPGGWSYYVSLWTGCAKEDLDIKDNLFHLRKCFVVNALVRHCIHCKLQRIKMVARMKERFPILARQPRPEVQSSTVSRLWQHGLVLVLNFPGLNLFQHVSQFWYTCSTLNRRDVSSSKEPTEAEKDLRRHFRVPRGCQLRWV